MIPVVSAVGTEETATPGIPKIVPYVNDFADILTPLEETSLNQMADAIEKDTTYEVAIVSVKNTNGMSLLDYANHIGDENGVGKKELQNGIVILWSEGEGGTERGMVIASGRGSNVIFNAAKLGRYAREALPYFDSSNYFLGFSSTLEKISTELKVKPEVKVFVPYNVSTYGGNEDTFFSTTESVVIILVVIAGIVLFFSLDIGSPL